MTWTTDKPTEPGWYWVQIYPVREFLPHLPEPCVAYFDGANWNVTPAVLDVLEKWAGPIPLPQDVTA